MSLQKTKPVHSASEQQYTTAGREIYVAWFAIHKRQKAEQGDWDTDCWSKHSSELYCSVVTKLKHSYRAKLSIVNSIFVPPRSVYSGCARCAAHTLWNWSLHDIFQIVRSRENHKKAGKIIMYFPARKECARRTLYVLDCTYSKRHSCDGFRSYKQRWVCFTAWF